MCKKRLIFFIFFFAIINFTVNSFAQNKEEEYFSIAKKAFSDGFYDASIFLFEKFVKDYPYSSKLPLAKLHIAKSLYFKKEYLKALSIFDEIVSQKEIKNSLDEVYWWLGKISFEIKICVFLVSFNITNIC